MLIVLEWQGDDKDRCGLNARNRFVLILQVWQDDKHRRGLNASYVWNKRQLDIVDVNRTDYLLGKLNVHCVSLFAINQEGS